MRVARRACSVPFRRTLPLRCRHANRVRGGDGMFRVHRAVALGVAAMVLAPAGARAQAVVSPQVGHTGSAPTGYEVTFRIADAAARRMRIKGEWYFSNAADIAAASAPPNAPSNNPDPRSPAQWKVGDFPLGSPNNAGANWPVDDMVKDANGVWTFTTPLPSG